jgi:hypothetical protein
MFCIPPFSVTKNYGKKIGLNVEVTILMHVHITNEKQHALLALPLCRSEWLVS